MSHANANTLEEISKQRTENWVENQKFERLPSNESSSNSESIKTHNKRPDSLSLCSQSPHEEIQKKTPTKFGISIRKTLRNSFRLKRSASEPGKFETTPKALSRSITYYKQRQPPTPLVVEDPPSSDDCHQDDNVNRLFGDPSYLNGLFEKMNVDALGFNRAFVLKTRSSLRRRLSLPVQRVVCWTKRPDSSSGCFASGASPGAQGAPRSAPGTPLGGGDAGHHQPQGIQRSPSHAAFTQRDKASLKHLSTSTPAMTAQAHPGEPPSPKASSRNQPKTRTASKARQKKFLRHFPNVEEDEKVLNHYSCALIGDILLQGHLYITKNYFAFYSNVFGYVTKLLIPVLTVEDITKEKTARIIPNAVGITTGDDKHVFGSLMSRDSTLTYMKAVWEKAKTDNEELAVPELDGTEHESSESGEVESGRESPSPDILPATTAPTFTVVRKRRSDDSKNATNEDPMLERKGSKGFIKTLKEAITEFRKLPRQSLILFATTLLLILLFLSAAVLLYRISKIQNRYSMALGDNVVLSDGEDIYSDILQWQTHLHSKSAGAVHTFLDNNLDQIAKVRQSLEALSTLLVQNNNNNNNNNVPLQPPQEDAAGVKQS